MWVTFVGTGVSTGIPVMGHLKRACACRDALMKEASPNRRNNVSVLLRPHNKKGPGGSDEEVEDEEPEEPEEKGVGGFGHGARTVSRKLARVTQHPAILVDCGKTFRDAYFRVLAPLGIEAITALLLTHDHADAMMGIDDLRDLQALSFTESTGVVGCHYYVPCYASRRTLDMMRSQVGYIYRASVECGEVGETVEDVEAQRLAAHAVPIPSSERRITCLDLLTLSDSVPRRFGIIGLPDVTAWSFPVIHGPNYVSMAFVWKTTNSVVVYISDVSEIPKISMEFLRSLEKIDILIIDMLLGPGQYHNCHYCIDDVMHLTDHLKPKRVWGVGMYCELEHHATNALLEELLQEWKDKGRCLGVEAICLAYDGLEFFVP